MNEMETAEMIERHIDYYVEHPDGEIESVHLPMAFVRHFMRRDDDDLPRIVAIATAPLVLADGHLLAPVGLDRLRGIQFEIPKELRAIIPKKVTDKDVREAMKFLLNEWLVDVTTDFAGKCIVLAAAMSIIERTLLPDRPVFFVTSGKRGSGKTTLIIMLIMAITGLMPAASAWSEDDEERRKALMSYLLYGVAYILWDNIKRGSEISCPHIEKACTSALYSDRKLGVSEIRTAAGSSIHIFTGNNIGPKGDLASRSLQIRLVTDRADPENRKFRHPDIIGWTENHRAEILAALYTIMLGNPQLCTPRDAPMKTRFKMWWRLVGSAIEHAAGLVGKRIDFQSLFLEQEEDEVEAASLADMLTVLAQWEKAFKAADVAKLANNHMSDRGSAVRSFLFPDVPANFEATSGAVTKRLQNYLDAPVKVGERTLILQSYKDPRTKALLFYVKVK